MITAADVRAMPLTVNRFWEGSDIVEVDAFLGRLLTTLEMFEQGRRDPFPVTPENVLDVRFTRTRAWRPGYDVVQLDDLLDLALAALRQYADVAAGIEVDEHGAAWPLPDAPGAPRALPVTRTPAARPGPATPATACSAVTRELSLAQATSHGDHRDVLVVETPDGARWAATSVTRTDVGIVLTVG